MKTTGKRLLALLAAIVLLFPAPSLAEEAYDPDEYYEVQIVEGTPAIDAGVNIRDVPSQKGDKVGTIHPGEICTVTDKSGDWYAVDFGGTQGYVRKDLLSVTKKTVLQKHIVEEPLTVESNGFDVTSMTSPGGHFSVSGKVRTNIPIAEVKLVIFNLRTLSQEAVVSKTFQRERNVLEFDASAFTDTKTLRKLRPGERRAELWVCSANEEQKVAEALFYVSGKCADPTSITDSCTISVSSGSKSAFLDDSYATSWKPKTTKDKITVKLPAKTEGGAISLEWDKAPIKVAVTFCAADGSVLSSISEKNAGQKLNLYYELPEGTRSVQIQSGEKGNGLCKMRVYAKDKIPPMIQNWQDAPEKVDMMLIVPHMNDETLYFSGTISQLTAQGKSVLVVYMTTDDRAKHAEALDCLWTHGLKIHPVFLGFKDYKVDTYGQAERLWGSEKTLKTLVSLLRKYKPEVVLTQDWNGEYGHKQHVMTSRYVVKSVEGAGSASVYPDTAEAYGTWDVKKLYLHLGDADKRLDLHFDTPMEELGGRSPMDIAFWAFDKHYSQLKNPTYSLLVDGRHYDCTWFSLYRSTVGEDVEKNSFFEHLD